MGLEKHAYRFLSDYSHIESIKEQCRNYAIQEEQSCKVISQNKKMVFYVN